MGDSVLSVWASDALASCVGERLEGFHAATPAQTCAHVSGEAERYRLVYSAASPGGPGTAAGLP